MEIREKAIRFGLGLWLMTAPFTFAQTDGKASTNSPAARTPLPPPLPPLPPGLAAYLRQNTNAPPPPPARQLPSPARIAEAASSNNIARPGAGLPAPSLSSVTNRPVQPLPQRPLPLTADAELKHYTARPGDTNAQFTFTLTNTSPAQVTINRTYTSCGCTVAKLPSVPWILEPGTEGQVHATVDLRGKHGRITKQVYVCGPAGTKTLTVQVDIPEDRARNMQIATADRQAVFKNDCARCHARPALGKKGDALYAAACGICHDSERRAAMVPDLRKLNHSTDRIFWKVWMTQGKPGTLMPGFGKAQGGPLTDEQIDSLVDYLAAHIPSRPAAGPSGPSAKLSAPE